jgi:hypothetical protein
MSIQWCWANANPFYIYRPPEDEPESALKEMRSAINCELATCDLCDWWPIELLPVTILDNWRLGSQFRSFCPVYRGDSVLGYILSGRIR